jgi:hypothetical protein
MTQLHPITVAPAPLIALVVDPEGRPLITINGRAYTPQQLAQALSEAERPAATSTSSRDAEPLPLLLGVPETARLIGLSDDEVYAMLDSGDLVEARRGRRRLVVVHSIHRWIQTARVERG